MPKIAQLPMFQAASNAPVYPSFHFIKYMGSKREIIDWVGSHIDDALGNKNGCVLDLMAGTAAVSYALSTRHRIVANDIQQYSTVLAQTLLRTTSDVPPSDAIWVLLEPHFQQNRKTLRRFLGKHLSTEEQFRNTVTVTRDVVKEYDLFQSQYPHAGDYSHSDIYNGLGNRFCKLVADRRHNQNAIPYCLFTVYFANAYFGLHQAIEIDSMRYAIDSVLPPGSQLRPLALSCLMHAASYCTPGPGHFAQFRALNSIAVCQDILRYRDRSIREYFTKKWTEFRDGFRRPKSEDNLCDSLDYKQALEKYVPQCDLVYVDPPYSFVHYSRFYHALETLVRYDYPGSEFYGRYRTDRHQSPFCIRVQVADAFKSIISPVAKLNRKLIFSYSNTAMITLEELKALCKQAFVSVSVKTNDYLHATMGRRGDKHREVEEALVICQP
jgi:adenine-specific DNA-methyltransferase